MPVPLKFCKSRILINPKLGQALLSPGINSSAVQQSGVGGQKGVPEDPVPRARKQASHQGLGPTARVLTPCISHDNTYFGTKLCIKVFEGEICRSS